MSVFETLVRVRARYGPVWDETPDGRVEHKPYLTPEQLGSLLNEVAWLHRAEGWGVNCKPSGNNVPAPDGTRIAADILHNRNDNVIVDCLVAAGERSEPTWNVLGQMTDPNRPWHAPTMPALEPPEPPQPPTQPPVSQPPSVDLAPVIDILADIHERLVSLETKLAANSLPWSARFSSKFLGTITGEVTQKKTT